MVINGTNHPVLFIALRQVWFDLNGVVGDPQEFEGQATEEEVLQAEAGLLTLEEEELSDFLIGEGLDQETISKRSPQLGVAHRLIDEFLGL
jgi:hypothetical protein